MSEIITYAELIEMPRGDERLTFIQIIRQMDGAYLTLQQEKSRG